MRPSGVSPACSGGPDAPSGTSVWAPAVLHASVRRKQSPGGILGDGAVLSRPLARAGEGVGAERAARRPAGVWRRPEGCGGLSRARPGVPHDPDTHAPSPQRGGGQHRICHCHRQTKGQVELHKGILDANSCKYRVLISLMSFKWPFQPFPFRVLGKRQLFHARWTSLATEEGGRGDLGRPGPRVTRTP